MTDVRTIVTTDHLHRRYLVVPAAIVEDDPPVDASNEAKWCAYVCDAAHPLAGLYAFADSLLSVRDAIARTAWSAVTAGELIKSDIPALTLSGVYVVATTCTVYDIADLAAATASDVA